MIKLDTPHESFVGGWHIDEKICDDLIQLFKDNKEHQNVGVSGGPYNVQKNVKDSVDLGLSTRSISEVSPFMIVRQQ